MTNGLFYLLGSRNVENKVKIHNIVSQSVSTVQYNTEGNIKTAYKIM